MTVNLGAAVEMPGAGLKRYLGDRADGSQSLAAEAKRADAKQVVRGAQLAGRVALKGGSGVLRGHPVPVVVDPDEGLPRVRELDARELGELFDVMGGLEALAGRLACERITAAEFSEIEELHHQMYAFYLKRDMPDYFRCNQLIHQKIVAAARNAALSTAYTSLAGRIRRVRYAANLAQKRDRWGEAMREHEAILDSMRHRDGRELSDILFRHLRNKQTAAIEYLEETHLDEPTDGKLVAGTP